MTADHLATTTACRHGLLCREGGAADFKPRRLIQHTASRASATTARTIRNRSSKLRENTLAGKRIFWLQLHYKNVNIQRYRYTCSRRNRSVLKWSKIKRLVSSWAQCRPIMWDQNEWVHFTFFVNPSFSITLYSHFHWVRSILGFMTFIYLFYTTKFIFFPLIFFHLQCLIYSVLY